MRNNSTFKKLFPIIAIPILGYALLLLTFVFDALFQSTINKFFPINYDMRIYWFPISKHILFAIIIAIISWFIFKSKLKDLYKAIYATVPTAVFLITISMFLYKWPITLYTVDGLIYGGIILYLYKTKKSWIFYYSVTLIALALLIMSILRIDI